MRYWYRDDTNHWRIADNAPSQLHIMVRSLPSYIEKDMIYSAMSAIASKKPVAVPPMDDLITWVATNPAAMRKCDELLQFKNHSAPTLVQLLAKAWSKEAHEVVDRIVKYFSA